MINEQELRKLLLDKLEAYTSEVYKLNDFMAKNPEIGYKEFKSSAAIVDLLRDHNIKIEYPFAGFDTAFKGIINPEKKNRMALLAEYDALIDLGHACGHCASGSASVLAALAFKSVENQLDFGVDIIGTPNEEDLGSKSFMANKGVFDNYDFAAMVHMGGISSVKVNFIAMYGLGVIWTGAASHAGSAPEQGRNALNAARLFMDAIDMMRQHIIQDARMHGYIKNGGSASNIVPEKAEIEFMVRAPKKKELLYIMDWAKDCARAAAMATKTDVEMFSPSEPFYDLHISELEEKIMCDCYKDLEIDFESKKTGLTGSSDIGNVDYHCPVFHPIMSIGKNLQVHTRPFAEEMLKPNTHNAIKNAAAFLVTIGAKLYGNEKLLTRLKTEHREYRGY